VFAFLLTTYNQDRFKGSVIEVTRKPVKREARKRGRQDARMSRIEWLCFLDDNFGPVYRYFALSCTSVHITRTRTRTRTRVCEKVDV
jgi:hypothetical protein